MKKVLIVYDKHSEVLTELDDLVEYLKAQHEVDAQALDYRVVSHEMNESILTLLYLDDTNIKRYLQNNLNTKSKIGFIPNNECTRAISSYGISNDAHEAIDEAMNEDNMTSVDVLTCNSEIVFTNAVIGDVHGLNYKNIDTQGIFTRIKSFYLNLKNLRFKDYTLTTAKDQRIQTAATGVMILEHNTKTGKYNVISENMSLHDGQLNAFIISPSNIFSYIFYLLIVNFYTKINLNNLPRSLGFIKTSKLDITSVTPIDLTIDGILMTSKEINLAILKDSLMLSIGQNTVENAQNNMSVDKELIEDEIEIIKTKHLPRGEVKDLLLKSSVPLFKKANEDDYKELFTTLKENAKLSSSFIVLMILSTLLATTGLFQSSAPVIIGAMILAPLMSPIISLSMAVVRGDGLFISTSIRTLIYGIATALVFSSIYTYFMPLTVLTDEMRGRLNPNILDLMVAIISGIAGAYANSKSEIAKSLAGVAIAVALVPPLSVTGIGIGWGNFDVGYGSFLLFTTNLVGITLAAAVTFLIMGYSPIHRAKKGIIYTSIILAMIAVPLVISFGKAIDQNNIIAKLDNYSFVENNKKVTIEILQVDLSKKQAEIFLHTNSNDILNKTDLNLLKLDIEKILKEKVDLHISSNIIID